MGNCAPGGEGEARVVVPLKGIIKIIIKNKMQYIEKEFCAVNFSVKK